MGNDDNTITVNEPKLFDYTSWAFDNRETLKDVLDDAGASVYFVRFIGSVRPNTRHSVLMTLFRHHKTGEGGAVAPNVDDCKEAYQLGGEFFEKLWDGKLAEAFAYSDSNNRALMCDEFTRDEIVSVGLTSSSTFNDREYLEKLISEKMNNCDECPDFEEYK